MFTETIVAPPLDNLNRHTVPGLLQRIIDGDTSSFDQLFMDMYTPVYMLTTRITGDEESSRDIVSDVFLQLWEKRQSLTHVKDVKAYLYVAARNRALNHLRKIKLTEKHALQVSKGNEGQDLSKDFFKMLLDTEITRVLYAAIRELPAECRRVMELSMDGQSTNEIAAQLNITASAVSHQKKRGLRLLREKMPPDLFLACLFFLSCHDI